MARIRGLHGSVKGLVFDIRSDETTVGRHETNKLVLSDLSVSTYHCVIGRKGGIFTIRDLGSTNGTRVNGELIKEQRLASGNLLRIGYVELMFEGEDVTPPEKDALQQARPEADLIRKTGGSSDMPGFKKGNLESRWMLWIIIVVGVVAGLAGAVAVLANLFGMK